MVEVLSYNPEGRSFDSRWGHRYFYRHNPSGLTTTLGSTQPLTEMSTRNAVWGVKAALTASCAEYLEILETSNSCSTKGLSRPVKE